MNMVMFRIKPIGTVCLMFVWNFLGKACWGFENLIMVLLPMCVIFTGNFIHLAENNAGTMYYYKCLPLYHCMILWRFIHNYNTHTCYYYGLQRRVSLCSHWGIILWIMYYFQSILLSFIVNVILVLFLFSTNDIKVDSCIGIHFVPFFQQGSYLTKQCQHYF